MIVLPGEPTLRSIEVGVAHVVSIGAPSQGAIGTLPVSMNALLPRASCSNVIHARIEEIWSAASAGPSCLPFNKIGLVFGEVRLTTDGMAATIVSRASRSVAPTR